MRATEPRASGNLVIHDFQIYFEDYGDPASPPILLLPSWQIAPLRHWKMQIPHLARTRRVITYDPPGIGGGERTTDPRAFELDRVVDYGTGLLDHLKIGRADVLGFSLGGAYGLWMAARCPERVNRLFLISPVSPEWGLAPDPAFWEARNTYTGWEKRNANYWREDYDGWLDFFMSEACSSPHSTKLFDDLVSWAKETTPEILEKTAANADLLPKLTLDEVLARVNCPVMLIHGDGDHIASIVPTRQLAERRPDFGFVTVTQGSHAVHARQPVRINQEIDAFLGPARPQRRRWAASHARAVPRALFISSPIGLGHVQRDLAVARELRRQVPNLEIDWLAQDPVTRVLAQSGERIHPRSAELASEATHWERSAHEHRLHCFQAFRDMDEILLANFMVFLDAVRETPYDLWIGDESWEVDHFLHENPELKRAPYIFMTDFVGWVPMDRTSKSREALLTADYNQQMLEQVERFPYVRDRALYFGGYDDLLPERFGPGLPTIPDWTRAHFEAVGYVTPFIPGAYSDLPALRARLWEDPDQANVLITVGGTGVGEALLRKVISAWPIVHRERPDVRAVLVAGPRIDPERLPHPEALEFRGYVHNLYERLAACDLAVVQGGLSTTMELTAARRPFMYVPIRDHCEQMYHVTHRLNRHRAGVRMEFDDLNPQSLAEVMLTNLGANTSNYLPVPPGAAERAASRIAELL